MADWIEMVALDLNNKKMPCVWGFKLGWYKMNVNHICKVFSRYFGPD